MNVNVRITLPPVKVKEIGLIFNFVSTYFGRQCVVRLLLPPGGSQ